MNVWVYETDVCKNKDGANIEHSREHRPTPSRACWKILQYYERFYSHEEISFLSDQITLSEISFGFAKQEKILKFWSMTACLIKSEGAESSATEVFQKS